MFKMTVLQRVPLGPILANIFMVELERSVIPTLLDKMKC